MTRQINDNGIPLVSGLDVFVPIITFGDERLSFNDSFTADTIPTATIATTLADYATEAVASAGFPKFKESNWFTYGTSGSVYPSIGTRTPSSSANKIIISAVVDSETLASSHSGIFQELKHLIPDNEYRLTINLTHESTLGVISVSRIYNVELDTIVLTQSNVTEFAIAQTASQIVMDFKAYSPSDIIFIDYSSTVNLNNAVISSISIKEKNEYRNPVIVNSPLTGSSTVLARKYNSAIPADEGQPRE